jgi:hypothetical protein
VGRPAGLQLIDRAIQRFPHETLGDSIGMVQGDDQRPPPPVPTATSPWPTSWHAHRRLGYVPALTPTSHQPFRFGVQGLPGATITLLITNQAPGQGLLASWSCSGSRQHGWGLTAPTIPCDGVARGLQRFQPCRLVLAAVGAENRNSNGGHRVLLDSPCMQASANDQLPKHPGGGEQL